MADRPLMVAAISRAYRVREYCYSNLTSRTNEHVSVHVDTRVRARADTFTRVIWDSAARRAKGSRIVVAVTVSARYADTE